MIQNKEKLLLDQEKYDKSKNVFIQFFIMLFSQDESFIRTEDILDILYKEGHSIALVMIGGVQYYSGQLFDIETITRVAHEQVNIPK